MSTNFSKPAALTLCAAAALVALPAYAGYSRAQITAKYNQAKAQQAAAVNNASGTKKTKIQNTIQEMSQVSLGSSQYQVSGSGKAIVPLTNNCTVTVGNKKGHDVYHRYTLYLNDIQSITVSNERVMFTKKSSASRAALYTRYTKGSNGPWRLNKTNFSIKVFSNGQGIKIKNALNALKTVCGSSGGAV